VTAALTVVGAAVAVLLVTVVVLLVRLPARAGAGAEHRVEDELRAARDELRAATEELRAREERLTARDERLTGREERAAADARRLEELGSVSVARDAALQDREQHLAHAETDRLAALERVAGLTRTDARAELVGAIEHAARRQAALTVRDLEAEARATADTRAREVVAQAIQRVASETTTETVVSLVPLPSEDMKGRIIGREGRNIRTFETVTGVNVVIDDTPGAVGLSCFDPVRREVARRTMTSLLLDGRIHPHRIEETHERVRAEVEAGAMRAGEEALLEVGIADVHPELVALLGRLQFRTSYGQNVLRHLVETAHIAAGMAAELGLGRRGIASVKRGAFLHDIGKALTHEVEGSHALVGAELARRHGESDDVVHAIEAHHLEVAPTTLEAWLTIGSDSCSGGRPGARRESVESYVGRLQRIEEIARSKAGVDRVFAMSAGHELRVMVLPEQVDDIGARLLAGDIAQQLETELTYPGQIKVTVVRESRATETAH